MPNSVERQVASLIGEEMATLRDFVAALQLEQQALTLGNLDELLPLAKTKGDLAARLSVLDDRRLHAIGARAGNDQSERMASWLGSVSDPELATDWQTLLKLAAQARQLNATNGKLIAERMRHNQQALAVLMAAGDAANLYGPDGQPRLGSTGRPLGSA